MTSTKRGGRAGAAPAKVPVQLRLRAERVAMGKSMREGCPRTSHATWTAPSDRPDPVSLLLKADEGRLPELLPLRHGRMDNRLGASIERFWRDRA